ncbi:MAG: hypothetical protein K8T10_18915 [Candidatus Eremiobacteraeota bacterium]|nr:hypothetical protein [Candidatus Eremiobacteraeota bacterium]
MKTLKTLLIITIISCSFFLMGSNGCTTSSYIPGYEVRVLGNDTFLSGSQGAMRIITYNPGDQNPVADVPVRIFLQGEKKKVGDKTGSGVAAPEKKNPGEEKAPDSADKKTGSEKGKEDVHDYGDKVFQGITDKTGSLDAAFKIPEEMMGSAKLTIVTGLEGKTQNIPIQINVKKKFKIYLTTDKPLYQPGQIINIRALSLNTPSLKPVAEKEIVLEVEDAKGNKVFKKKSNTSKFGIAHAKFQLADEVNMGEFHIRALLDRESSEKSVTVKKYVLPKFKIDFKKNKKFYTPGETIKGEIQADYFFGKPISGGKVSIKLFTFDVEFKSAAEVKGVTDKKGHYSFELKIPDYLVGQPLEKGGAMAKMDIEITDAAGQKVKNVKKIPISKDSLKVQLIPESGALKLNLENRIFLLSSYPDGSPAKTSTTLTIKFQDSKVSENIQVLNTDEAGIATFNLKPPDTKPITVQISAITKKGDKLETTQSLSVTRQKENVILRTDRAEYNVGDTMNLEILSTKGKGSYYLDAIKDRQTILTKAFDVDSTRYKSTMDITPDLAGLITLSIYRITGKNQIIRDRRNIFVRSADDLKISAAPDKPEYKPGGDAKITFTVTDKSGKPVIAAMGVDIVDEAVFALGEMMPGLERVYFLLEKQLMEPKYEIHGITLREAIMPTKQIKQDQQIIRQILFAKIPTEEKFSINIDTYKKKIQECYRKMSSVMNGMHEYYRKYNKYPTTGDLDNMVKEGLIKEKDAIDPWGHKFYLMPQEKGQKFPEIKSAGPNGKIGDKDDLILSDLQKKYVLFDNTGLVDRDSVPVRAMKGGFAPRPAAKMEAGEMHKDKMEAPAGSEGAGKKPVRVREYFPETLYTNPQIITDEKGNAEIGLKMADSITTWRMSVFGNSASGKMGNLQSGIKVFQDFFIDIDFPVALTRGDEISVPIAVYNYLKEPQTVKIKVEKEDWFEMMDGVFEKELKLQKNEVKGVNFRIKAKKLGKHKLTVYGYGSKMEDAVRREIEILPDGKMFMLSKSDKIQQEINVPVNIPKGAVKGASKILVRLYPGVISQVVEGLDKILRMPCGCFEQTSASTYPNALVLEYLKKQKKVTPEIQMKAEGYINTGYQKLVSFEVQGGGFSWFGTAPANRVLTAFGVMEFCDMAKVHDVDENLIDRTRRWLAAQQNKDGSWSPDKNYCHAESWAKMQGGGKIPVTSYIVWALAESGHEGEDLKKGMAFLKKKAGDLNDPYVLSLACNAFATVEPESQFTAELIKKLAKKAKITAGEAYWATGIQTGTFSRGKSANIETTALATLACLKVKRYENLASKGISFLVKNKDPYGTWGTTQGTILAMKALLTAQDKATQKVNAKVKITVNDERSEEFEVTSENYDVYRQADFGDVTKNGKNKVTITISGEGSCYYQVATRYYMPWGDMAKKKKPLSIGVKYDRTKLKENDMLTNTVTIRNNTKAYMKMVMVDLGIPPGFSVMTPDLNELVGKKFMKYSMTSRQIVIYIETMKPGENLQFKYRLKAKFPLKAKTPRSKTYQYYNPDVNDVTKPVMLEVD